MKIDFKKILRYINPNNVDNLEAINPYRNWKVSVIFSCIFLVVILLADGYVLWKSLHVINENIVLEEQAAITAINKSSLNYKPRLHCFMLNDASGRGRNGQKK